MDDLTLSGNLETVEKDVAALQDAAATTGFELNTSK